MKPITPSEVSSKKAGILPPEVIDTFNKLIAKNWSNGRSVVKCRDAADAVSAALSIDKSCVFANKYLDVEDVFRSAGWKVVYDQPAYNESYDAHFIFSAK